MKFGVREITNVTMKAKAKLKLGNKTYYKDEPVVYFDTLKTSSLEGATTTVYATGGRGNSRLIAWEGEKTLTFNMEDALLTPETLAILSSAALEENAAVEIYPLEKEVSVRLNDWVAYLSTHGQEILDGLKSESAEGGYAYYTTTVSTGVPYIAGETNITTVDGYKISNIFNTLTEINEEVNVEYPEALREFINRWLVNYNASSGNGVALPGQTFGHKVIKIIQRLVVVEDFIEEFESFTIEEINGCWSNILNKLGEENISLTLKYNIVNPATVNKEAIDFEHIVERVQITSTKIEDSDDIEYTVRLEKPIRAGEPLYLKPVSSFTKLGKVLVAPKEDGLTYVWKASEGSTSYSGDIFTGTAVADYYSPIYNRGVKKMTISMDMVGMNFYLEANTLFRDTNGFDHPAIFVIPNCKVQSNFTFNMASSGDPSTFNFVLDAFPGVTRFDSKKKVLAVLQILGEEVVTLD